MVIHGGLDKYCSSHHMEYQIVKKIRMMFKKMGKDDLENQGFCPSRVEIFKQLLRNGINTVNILTFVVKTKS